MIIQPEGYQTFDALTTLSRELSSLDIEDTQTVKRENVIINVSYADPNVKHLFVGGGGFYEELQKY